MGVNPFSVVKDFEDSIAKYTGAKYAVAVDSCTNAIFLCCKYLNVKHVTIPARTYLSIPMSIIHSGGEVIFDKDKNINNWEGIYQLKPYPIWDSAKGLHLICISRTVYVLIFSCKEVTTYWKRWYDTM